MCTKPLTDKQIEDNKNRIRAMEQKDLREYQGKITMAKIPSDQKTLLLEEVNKFLRQPLEAAILVPSELRPGECGV